MRSYFDESDTVNKNLHKEFMQIFHETFAFEHVCWFFEVAVCIIDRYVHECLPVA